MAMGLPVIASDVGPIPEIITNMKDGILVKLIPIEIADKIESLLNNDALRNNMGLNARKTIENNFNINDKIKEFISILNN
jgi:glycosyltransferase involved in cell wall biosynthesis